MTDYRNLDQNALPKELQDLIDTCGKKNGPKVRIDKKGGIRLKVKEGKDCN